MFRIKGGKPNKFRAKKTKVDGIVFASAKEAGRYSELKLLLKSGAITRLELQPSFPVFINGVKCFIYRADFSYFDGDSFVVEDVKGMKTAVYRLKKRCVEAMYPGIRIVEI